MHFAGVPPAGVKPSTPTVGQLVVSLRPNWEHNMERVRRRAGHLAKMDAHWRRHRDSRRANALDTGYVQLRLTPARPSTTPVKIAATGLFDHDLKLNLRGHDAQGFDRVRIGARIVTVAAVSSGGTGGTPAELNALTSLSAL